MFFVIFFRLQKNHVKHEFSLSSFLRNHGENYCHSNCLKRIDKFVSGKQFSLPFSGLIQLRLWTVAATFLRRFHRGQIEVFKLRVDRDRGGDLDARHPRPGRDQRHFQRHSHHWYAAFEYVLFVVSVIQGYVLIDNTQRGSLVYEREVEWGRGARLRDLNRHICAAWEPRRNWQRREPGE